jgi:purine-binding chemotaxis protein CheW
MSAINPVEMQAVAQVLGPRECLTFRIGAEDYGIDILQVQEVRSYEAPTRIAQTQPQVLGVLNLRGEIVPVIDMRLQLGLAQANFDDSTVVIVLKVGARVFGLVVDGVSDVVGLSPEQLRPVPGLGCGIAADLLLAIATMKERLLLLVDIDKLMRNPAFGLSAV